jgi:hypothetical protein
MGLVLLAATAMLVAVWAAAEVEGFGSRTVGGDGREAYWVDPALGDDDSDMHGLGTQERPMTLRRALSGGDRTIRFTRGGTITLNAAIYLEASHVTIDGDSAAAPGITITHTPERHGGLIIGSPGRRIHDFVIRNIRFRSIWPEPAIHKSGYTILGVYIDDNTGGKVSNIVLDRLTLCHLPDKVSFWGHIQNVTISRCLFYTNHMSLLVSMYSQPFQLRRKGFSITRNVFARSCERNPQLRGWIEDLELVNNLVYDWESYGMRIKNQPGEKPINANVVNNVFLPGRGRANSAILYGWDPGPDNADRAKAADFPQETVYTDNAMGRLYVRGNLLPPENRDHYSTIAKPLRIPDWAKLTTLPAERVAETILPEVGMRYRTAEEDAILAEIAQAAKA